MAQPADPEQYHVPARQERSVRFPDPIGTPKRRALSLYLLQQPLFVSDTKYDSGTAGRAFSAGHAGSGC